MRHAAPSTGRPTHPSSCAATDASTRLHAYLRRRASRSHSSSMRMSPSRIGPLTLRTIERDGSSRTRRGLRDLAGLARAAENLGHLSSFTGWSCGSSAATPRDGQRVRTCAVWKRRGRCAKRRPHPAPLRRRRDGEHEPSRDVPFCFSCCCGVRATWFVGPWCGSHTHPHDKSRATKGCWKGGGDVNPTHTSVSGAARNLQLNISRQ